MMRTGLILGVLMVASAAVAAGQPPEPIVTMNVTLPDGRTEELTAHESGLATIRVNGAEYGFRPTIQDSSPWNRIVVTIFRTATASAPTQILGEVEVQRGGPAMGTKTNPTFKIAVSKVAPSTRTSSTSQ